MYFVPLSQIESVELVAHALRAAGGEADCTQCPVYRVCMKQCLTIADAVGQMLADGSLPKIGGEPEPAPQPEKKPPEEDPDKPSGGGGRGRLKVIK
jgi:hypothetical protein